MKTFIEFLWDLCNKEPNVDKENTYCEECGRKLVYEKKVFKFSKTTGEPVAFAHILKCPELSCWWDETTEHTYYIWNTYVKEKKNG